MVDDEGVVSHAVLAFPDYDEEIEGADDSCRMLSGNCGTTTVANASVSGEAVLGATMETAGEGRSRTYDLVLRTASEVADAPFGEHVRSRVYHFTDRSDLSEFGKPTECYNTTRNVSVTLTFRDGDDGS